jgi:hypothetical protein
MFCTVLPLKERIIQVLELEKSCRISTQKQFLNTKGRQLTASGDQLLMSRE